MDPTPPVGWVAPPPSPARGRSGVYLVGFAPLAFLILLGILAPGFFAPMLDTTVPTGGIGLGLPILLVAGALTLVGVGLMWRFQAAWAVAVSLIVFTFPAMFLILLGPAVCLIAQNLST